MPPPPPTDSTAFELRLAHSPSRQRRRFLATREVAPQTLAPALAAELAHLGNGTAATPPAAPLVRGLFRALRPLWLKVAGFAILGRIALLAAVWASSRVFDDWSGYGVVLQIAGGYLLFQIVGAVFNYLSDATRGQLAVGVEVHLATVVNRKLLRLAPAQAGAFASGNLKNLVSSDVGYFAEFVSTLVWNLTPALASLAVLAPAVYLLAGLPGLAGILSAFLNVPIAVLFSRLLERQQLSKQERLDKVATLVGEWLRNVRLARYLGWQDAVESEIAAHLRRYMVPFLKRHALMCVTFGISFSWWMVPVLVILATGRLLDVPLDLKGFFTTLWVVRDLAEYLQHLPHAINLHASATACLKRMEALLGAPELAQSFKPQPAGARAPSAGALPQRLVLRGVGVRYGERAALQSLDLELDLTRRTAVVGPVGAGKTTLLRLLCGELAPDAGQVDVVFDDGVTGDLWREDVQAALRRALAYVPQEPFISSATLATNISLDERPAPGDDVIQAAYLAELESDVRALRRGFDEPIGETGVNLSGGQKQRVNLARAFLARRPVLLLDDPLSAVDARTESALMDAIEQRCAGFILVSHRLAELTRVDRILVLDDGRIVEDGAPEALLAQADSRFARLLAALGTREAPP